MGNPETSLLKNSCTMLVYSEERTIYPQQSFPFDKKPNLIGVDDDGETIRYFNFVRELNNTYFILFFFPMDFKVDSSEVLQFSSKQKLFKENRIAVVGVTQDSPEAIRHWIKKDTAKGGFGKPVDFPIISDKDQYLAQLMGVAKPSGMPCRSTFIIDWTGNIRYINMHESKIGRSVEELLRIVVAFRHSDLTGEITPALWTKGKPVIPTDYSEKIEFFRENYGEGKSKREHKKKTEDKSSVPSSGTKGGSSSTASTKPSTTTGNPSTATQQGSKAYTSTTSKADSSHSMKETEKSVKTEDSKKTAS